MTKYVIKRIYEPATDDDGYRVLVDRLWPRGVSKDKAQLDEWCKEVAPSTELRTWFNHIPERFDEFTKRYVVELTTNSAVDTLRQLTKDKAVVTLLYGAHDPLHNQAVVLCDFLSK
jgi:uncharacterized protein YeaO (DUF488 family)